jgi:hypothetical protein
VVDEARPTELAAAHLAAIVQSSQDVRQALDEDRG